MDEGEGGYGESADPMDQFHRNEAISAVADDGFLAEEDDDYEDLYNDVNVGEGFLQSLRKNDDSAVVSRNDDVEDKKPSPLPPVPDAAGVSIPGVGGGGEGVGVGGSGAVESRVSGRVDGFQNQGFRGNDIGAKGGIRVELGHQSGKSSEIEEQGGNDGAAVQGIGQQPHAGVVGSVGNEGMARQGGGGGGGGGGGNAIRVGGNGVGNSVGAVNNVSTGGVGGGGGGGSGSGGTILFVGDLH